MRPSQDEAAAKAAFGAAQLAALGQLQPSPFLHFGGDRFYDPLTDRTLLAGDPGYGELRDLAAGRREPIEASPLVVARLASEGWLVPPDLDLTRRFYLKYVALETHSVCNQACYFCPVSVAPRPEQFMDTSLFADVVDQLRAWRSTLDGVTLINYNEPTLDLRFVEQVELLIRAGLPAAVLTNGTGLTPARIDAIAAMGGLRYLSVNLSTLDRERYARQRGHDHLPIVLANLDHACRRPPAREMVIAVIGRDDEEQAADFEAIQRRFAGTPFEVRHFAANDRAAYLKVGFGAGSDEGRLRGCAHVGSRPLQHLHVLPDGRCVLCCQDYEESEVVGDLSRSTVAEVLAGAELGRRRAWTYGLEPAPEDFICRRCPFAIRSPSATVP